jgi:hypothetical protein
MAIVDQSGIRGKTRDRPITAELEQLLKSAAEATGIDVVFVTSGGQPGTRGGRTGSTRHDGGRAADLQLIKDGQTLTFSDSSGAQVAAFVTAAAARGSTGIGAGVAYMGNKTIHVGFGTSVNDRTKLTWGAGGRAVNAPTWLKRAAREGWDSPVSASGPGISPIEGPSQFEIIARGGLQLRKGPGLDFGITRTLETHTVLTVLGFDGPGGAWARVDLEGDGLVDGHVFARFLRPVGPGPDSGEHAPEPGEDEA